MTQVELRLYAFMAHLFSTSHLGYRALGKDIDSIFVRKCRIVAQMDRGYHLPVALIISLCYTDSTHMHTLLSTPLNLEDPRRTLSMVKSFVTSVIAWSVWQQCSRCCSWLGGLCRWPHIYRTAPSIRADRLVSSDLLWKVFLNQTIQK